MLSAYFPQLKIYVETSAATESYNCIAWACGDNTKWWWPDDAVFWPSGIRRDETVEAFDELFASGGAIETEDELLQSGWIKIALFAKDGVPTHAARQLPNGSWTSKLGKGVDIAHALRELEGQHYGRVAKIYAVKLPL